MEHEPDSNPDTTVRHRLGRSIRVLWIGITTLLLASTPAFAFADEFGETLGSSGGEQVMWLVWFGILLWVLYLGGTRSAKAASDCGSVHEDKRRRGHEEIAPALGTLLIGMVLVIGFSTFISEMMPESWSWLGVNLADYINLPFVGDEGGDAGSAASQAAPSGDPGMIFSDVLVDVSLHATDVVMVLF